jgi:hypothetical protein
LKALSVVEKVTKLTTLEYVAGKCDAVEVKSFIDVRSKCDREP